MSLLVATHTTVNLEIFAVEIFSLRIINERNIYGTKFEASQNKHGPSQAVQQSIKVFSDVQRREHTRDDFRGKCPTIAPSFFTATAYLSAALSGSLSPVNDSPKLASQTSLYIWYPRTQQRLCSSSSIAGCR